MAIDKYVTQTYPIKCKGRTISGNIVLRDDVGAKVKIYKSKGSNTISSIVKCQYNIGGQWCKADSLEVKAVGKYARCPYSFNIPHILDIFFNK